MTRLVTIENIQQIISHVGIQSFFQQLIDRLQMDFARWPEMHKSPRHVTHYPHGVIELMPIADDQYYAYKYVNGHPNNPQRGQLTVAAVGMLADVNSGYPILVSEMTLLTALRTAATAALAAKYLAIDNASTIGIIGTGSQSEFLVLAMQAALGIKTVRYFDLDAQAMSKFAENLSGFPIELIACQSAQQTVEQTQIVITATASKKQARVIDNHWIQPGQFIAAMGGDCAGKTELDIDLLKRSGVVVELLEQTQQEGEIQQLGSAHSCTELWEIITGEKTGRVDDQQIIIFDAVGFALEDYSVLRLVNQLCERLNIGQAVSLIPTIEDPKNLFGLLRL